MAEQGKPKGIYSTETKSFIGQGMTRRKTVQKRYWFVWDAPAGGPVIVSPLNQNMVPRGQKRAISYAEFAKDFNLESDFFVDDSLRVRKLWRGDGEVDKESLEVVRQERKGPLEDATLEPAEPAEPAGPAEPGELERVELEARADFGLGVIYLKRGEKGKALKIFESLADLEAEFQPRHKHMFNDFGIGLRKISLLKVALKHYRRALDLSPDDEHLFHNIARIHYELGDMDKAAAYLRRSLELNPQFYESKLFLRFIRKRQLEISTADMG